MSQNKPKSLLTLLDYSTEQVIKTLEIARDTKKDFLKSGPNQLLQGKTSVLIFEKPSLRTRVTFEVAMTQFGGSTITLDPQNISIGKRESVEDVSKNLSRWVDVLVARTFKHRLVEELQTYSQIPIVNALTDKYHPCQALAFAQTAMEHRGNIKGSKLVFIGDGNNVANSLLILCAHLGMDFVLACPKGYEQPEDLIKSLEPLFEKNGGSYEMLRSPQDAAKNADFLYTDVWVSMGEEGVKQDKTREFEGYQINAELVKHAKADCLVSHCLPAHRDEEITDEVMRADYCFCFDEAENRLHAQKAVLLSLLNANYSLE